MLRHTQRGHNRSRRSHECHIRCSLCFPKHSIISYGSIGNCSWKIMSLTGFCRGLMPCCRMRRTCLAVVDVHGSLSDPASVAGADVAPLPSAEEGQGADRGPDHPLPRLGEVRGLPLHRSDVEHVCAFAVALQRVHHHIHHHHTHHAPIKICNTSSDVSKRRCTATTHPSAVAKTPAVMLHSVLPQLNCCHGHRLTTASMKAKILFSNRPPPPTDRQTDSRHRY